MSKKRFCIVGSYGSELKEVADIIHNKYNVNTIYLSEGDADNHLLRIKADDTSKTNIYIVRYVNYPEFSLTHDVDGTICLVTTPKSAYSKIIKQKKQLEQILDILRYESGLKKKIIKSSDIVISTDIKDNNLVADTIYQWICSRFCQNK